MRLEVVDLNEEPATDGIPGDQFDIMKGAERGCEVVEGARRGRVTLMFHGERVALEAPEVITVRHEQRIEGLTELRKGRHSRAKSGVFLRGTQRL